MKKYDKDFKKEAVKKYLDGQSVASISREIGVNENTIHTAVGRNRFCQSMVKLTKRSWRCGNGLSNLRWRTTS